MRTPGPWFVKQNPGSIWIESPTETIARVGVAGVDQEDQANARLIAAAPELLRLLQALLPYAEQELKGLEDQAPDDDQCAEEAKTCGAAIKQTQLLIRQIEKGTK